MVRRMRAADLPEVMHIERRSFTAPWEEATFRALMRRPSAALLVAAVVLEGLASHLDAGFVLAADEELAAVLGVCWCGEGREG